VSRLDPAVGKNIQNVYKIHHCFHLLICSFCVELLDNLDIAIISHANSEMEGGFLFFTLPY